jgi:hypothetical protein
MPPKRKRAAASTNAPKAKVPKSETTATAATGPVLNIKLASDPSKIPVLPFDILTEIVDHLGRDASSGDSQALAGLAGLMPLSSEMYALASVQLYRRVVLTATQWDKFLYGVPHFTVKDQKALAKAEAKAAGPGTKGRRPRPKKPAIELTPTKGSERKLALLKLVRGVRYESAKKVPLLPSQRLFPALETLEIAPRTYLDILDDGAEGFSTVTIEHALFKAMALERPRHVCIGIPTTAEAKDYIKRRAPPGRGPRDGGHGHPNCDCAARQAQGRFEKLQRGRGLEWFAEVVRDWKPESVTIHHWRFYAAPTFATEYLRLFPADCPCTAVLPVDPTLRVGRLVHAHVEHCIANDIRFWERAAHSLHGATHGLMYSLKDKPTRIEVPGIGSNVPAGTMCCAESYASTLRRYKTGLVRFAGESLSTPNAADAAPCSCCGVRPPADFADVEKTLLPTITCVSWS